MSTFRLVHQVFLYDDPAFSNEPNESRLRYGLDETETFKVDYRLDRKFPNSSVTALSLTGGPFKWFYLLCDQPIKVRFDANVDDTCAVEPVTPLTLDGLLIKRGSFNTLSINVPGTTDARVVILAGVI